MDDYVIVGFELKNKLAALRESSAKNKGNRNSGPGRKHTKLQIADTDEHVRKPWAHRRRQAGGVILDS